MKITPKDLELLERAAELADCYRRPELANDLRAIRYKLTPDICTRIVNPTLWHRNHAICGVRCIHDVFLDCDCPDCSKALLKTLEV